MRKPLIFGFILLQNLISFGQVSFDFNQFSKPDMEFKLSQKFFKGDSVIFVIPNAELSHSDSIILLACKNSKRIKRESELKNEDYSMKLHIWGKISDFKNWEKFDLPIKKTTDGFQYDNINFNKDGNCIYYMNSKANRLVYAGNSITSIDPIRRSLLGTYQIYIFSDNLILYNGNANEPLNDLNKVREMYFNKTRETEFSNLYFTSKPVISNGFIDSIDNHIVNVAHKLDLDTRNFKKTNFFLYNNLNDLAYISGMPSPMQMSGLNVNNIAHATRIDIKTIKHEATHWLILQTIGGNSNNFYNEGLRQYTDYLIDSTAYEIDLLITKFGIAHIRIVMNHEISPLFHLPLNNLPSMSFS
jgi:hypothetical protein